MGEASDAALKRAEREGGLLVGKKPLPTDGLGAPSFDMEDLKRWDGHDIVRKGGSRKTRHLFVLPACLTTTPGGGKLGQITKMDTENPVLYIDFPQGRLKCLGRIVHPTSRFLPLSFESKEVACKDIITTIIVFSQVEWVGTIEDNPDEKTLPLPNDLFEGGEFSTTTVAEAFKREEEDRDGGRKKKAATGTTPTTTTSPTTTSGVKRPRRSSAPTKKMIDIGTSSEEDMGEEEEEEEEEEQQQQEEEEEGEQEEEEEEEVEVVKPKKRASGPSRGGGGGKKRRKVVLDDDDEDEEEDDGSVEVVKTSGKDAGRGHLRRSSAGTAKYTFSDNEDEEEEKGSEGEEEAEEDDDDGGGDESSEYDGDD